MKKYLTIFILLIIATLLTVIETKSEETTKTESCDSKTETCEKTNDDHFINEKGEEVIIKSKPKILYSNNFLQQPYAISSNNTDEASLNFDFRINRKMQSFLSRYGMVTFPRERYIGKQQGNFLHFMHLAYSKNLPLYFDLDQMIYPYIEITKNLIRETMKKGLYNVLKEFLINVINYGKKENYDKGILLYFSIGLKLLDKNEIVFHNDICEKLVNNLLNIEKGETNHIYNFTLMNNIRSINKLSFEQKRTIFKGEEKLEAISDMFRFFQNFQFQLNKEFYIVYKIGNLISKSNQDLIFKEIKRFTQYIFSEEEYIMNPLEIYTYISNNYRNYTMSNETANDLYQKIKKDLIKNTSLFFMGNNSFINEKEKEEFYNLKNTYTSLFSFSYLLEEFICYKLINYDKMRYYPSFFEFVDIVHHGELMQNVIFDRFKGKKLQDGGRLLPFRDSVDMSDIFNYTKKIVKDSLIKEKEKWLDSYENSFNYLLNIMGHMEKNAVNDEDKKVKTFNSLIGAYVHFKQENILFKQKANVEYESEGDFLDLYFNPNVKFYTVLEKISTIFQNHLLDLINCMQNKTIKIKLEQNIERKMKRLFTSYENILKYIEIQDKIVDKTELKKMRDNMFHYDKKKDKYKGWYVDLYKDNDGEINYGLDIYLYNYFMAQPSTHVNFKGVIDFISMHYPEFGIILVGKGEYSQRKMFLFSSYVGNEYPILWTEKVNFDGLKEIIMRRI